MNIFWLDERYSINAAYYMDSHVRKIILECAQIMSTTCHHFGYKVRYKPTHINHPLCVWARESLGNYNLVREMSKALNDEYRYRFDKEYNHSSYDYIKTLPSLEGEFDKLMITPRPCCFPLEYWETDIIISYRNYYRVGKRHLAKWTKRTVPYWF